MGSIKFPNLLELTKQIWQWCEEKNIGLFASYVTSKNNWVADRESRQSSLETEWSLSQEAFDLITVAFGTPEVDLFASIINHKCEKYVSWYKDPDSMAVDAFTLNWKAFYFYAFPPFSLVLRTIQKILLDKAEVIIVAPFWPSQPWYPPFSELVVGEEIFFTPDHNLLSSPFNTTHPLAEELTLVVAKLSGKRI